MLKNRTIQPSERIKEISEYYFSVKLKEVARMNAEGKEVINLGIGSPDLPPSPKTIDKFCQSAKHSDTHGYQPYVGICALREAWTEFYKKSYNANLSVSEVLPLIGSKEGIMHISMAFLNAGDSVLIPNPGYPTYSSVTALMQAKAVYYDLTENNRWIPDFNALEQMDLSHVKLMWVNYPHMPTGANASKVVFEKLIAFGKKHQIIICHDNPYSFVLNDNPMSILSIEGAKEICIELNSMSKSHNMPGWRMGVLASNNQFVQWILNVKSNVDSGQFKPMQLAAIESLSASKKWHDDINQQYAKRRVWVEKILDLLGCTYNKKQVGLFVWAKLPKSEANSSAFIDNILYKAYVFLTPGFIFGTNGEGYIRISLCANEKKLKEAFNRIKKLNAKR